MEELNCSLLEMESPPPGMTSTPPIIQPPLRLRVQLPTRASFLANGVHQLELILQYGALEEHVLMIDIHGHLGLHDQNQDEPVVGVSHNFVTINSFPPPTPPPTSNKGEEGSGGGSSVGNPGPPSLRKRIPGRRKTLFSTTCQTCHKRFTNKSSLANHSYVHLSPEEKEAIKRGWKNKCHFCLKLFQTPSLLATHLVVHTREKPHPCDHCGKQFNQKPNLTTHRRLHNQDPATRRPFQCTQCDKSFTTNQNLTVHVKRVHFRLKEFQCPECGQKFATKDLMLQHLNAIHLGIRYPCWKANCGKTFSCKPTLQRHEKRAH